MEFLYVAGGIALIVLFFVIKHFLWDKPHKEIKRLEEELKKQQEKNKKESNQKNKDKLPNLLIVKNEFKE